MVAAAEVVVAAEVAVAAEEAVVAEARDQSQDPSKENVSTGKAKANVPGETSASISIHR